TAAVVRHGRHIFDHADLKAHGLDRTHRGFTSGARTFHTDFHFLQSVAHRLAAGVLRDHLRGVSGALARAFKAALAGTGPADHVASHVGDADDRIVERSLHVRDARVDVLASLGFDD